MRIGSLFSGAGMLDVAALELFPGSSLAWHCETDPAACRVLAHHWPSVANLGDVSRIDWAATQPVDVITGGFPCQDLSTAGIKAGMAGSRSGLWSHMRDAIAAHRPASVLIENVRGLLSAAAVRNVESDPDGLGDNDSESVLRALGAVLGDLADIGFDADWTCVLASEVGACHRRARVFIHAYPADAARGRPQGGDDLTGSQAARRRREWELARSAGTRTVRVGPYLPTPDTGTSPNGHGRRGGVAGNGYQSGISLDAAVESIGPRWGVYEPVIRRQERLSRSAPSPTEPNRDGQPRLSAAFAEWMMFWPTGFVTDPAIGLTRTEQLKIIGNGVCVPQALAAYRVLFGVEAAA